MTFKYREHELETYIEYLPTGQFGQIFIHITYITFWDKPVLKIYLLPKNITLQLTNQINHCRKLKIYDSTKSESFIIKGKWISDINKLCDIYDKTESQRIAENQDIINEYLE